MKFLRGLATQAGRTRFARHIFALGSLFPALVLGSCSGARGRFSVLEGTLLASRGWTTEAMGAYMDALRYEIAAPYGEYGLGTLFLGLGEHEAALVRFSAAEALLAVPEVTGEFGGHRELLFRIRYNTAVGLFLSGDYPGAAETFRKALEVDGSRIEAKRNLELSLRAITRQENVAASSAPMEVRPEAEGPRGLFDFIRQKEGEQWKSREASGDAGTAEDY